MQFDDTGILEVVDKMMTECGYQRANVVPDHRTNPQYLHWS